MGNQAFATAARLAGGFLLIGLFVPGISGCGDDDATGPPLPVDPSVTVAVVDAGGHPVQGLEVALANHVSADLPIDPAAKPTVTFQISTPQAVHAVGTILDVEGTTIQPLIDEHLTAGDHQIQWNGYLGSYPDWEHLPSGHYVLQLQCRDPETDELLFEDEAPMAMVLVDPDQYRWGTTDADGKIAISDPKLFPSFFEGLADQMSYDAMGNPQGLFNWIEEVLVALKDPGTGHLTIYARPITRGDNRIELVWDGPLPLSTAGGETGQPAPFSTDARPAPTSISPVRVASVPGGDPEFSLQGPFPNPFN